MEQIAKEVVRRLERSGYEAYFVGGCVRDKWLGRPLKDIDIATSATPDEVMRLFDKTVPTGLKHGTVTVVMDGCAFEVTTFRKESEYEQFRRPKSVEFVSDLHEDLLRRDFTMNAMALDSDGRWIDPFGGRSDLERGVLRCVGDPEQRFREDALRMMRCIRFAAEYGLAVEERTWAALQANAPLIRHVAMERVGAETEKIVEGRDPDTGLRLLAESGLMPHFKLPLDLPVPPAGDDAGSRPACRLAELRDAPLRWTYWLMAAGREPEAAKTILSGLKLPGAKIDRILRPLQVRQWMNERFAGAGEAVGAGRAPEAVENELREAVAESAVLFGKRATADWLVLLRHEQNCDCAPEGGRPDAAAALRSLAACRGPDWIERMPVSELNELAVGGDDLMRELKAPAGPWVGRTLRSLLVDVAAGRLPNERDVLLEAAKTRAERERI
jgi:tRNA nucleotidyltransferase (CCA-adding enzyme)